MNRIVIVLLSMLTGHLAIAQPETAWLRSFGGNGDDYGRAVAVVDGGYIVAGTTNSFYTPSTEVYLLRLNEAGEYAWGRNFGVEGYIDWAVAVAIDSEGNIIMAGYTNNSQGNGYDGLLMKVDNVGNLLWSKNYGGPDWDFFYTVAVDDVGSIYIAGEKSVKSKQLPWLLKVNIEGNIEWESFFECQNSGFYSSLDYCEADALMLLGTCAANNDENSLFVTQINSEGIVQWFKEDYELGNSKSAGGRCGQSSDFLFNSNAFFDLGEEGFSNIGYWGSLSLFNGEENWVNQATFINPKVLNSIHSFETGEILMAGSTAEDGFGGWDGNSFWMSPTGNQLPGITFPIFGGFEDDRFYDIAPTPDGGYIAVGETNSFGNGHQVMVAKVGPNNEISQQNVDFLDVATSVRYLASGGVLNCWPNPTNGSVTVSWPAHFAAKATFKLLDISGRMVHTGELSNQEPTEFPPLSPGPYFLKVENEAFQEILRVLVSY